MTAGAREAARGGAGGGGEPAVRAEGLSRRFARRRREVWAVRDLDLAVPRGAIFGLLGPNGAGKTTTVKLLATLLTPTSGSATVLGHDVRRDSREIRRRVGYVFGGDRGFYDRVSGLDNLRYFASLQGVAGTAARRRISELAERFGIASALGRPVETYSRGMRQRLHLVRGVLHEPELLMLDEPTIGLDPAGAREIRAAVAELRAAGVTVLLTTHYMAEAASLCDDLTIIAAGSVVARGTPEEVARRSSRGSVLEARVHGPVPERLRERLAADYGVTGVHTVEHSHHTTVVIPLGAPSADVRERLPRTLAELGVTECQWREPTLEDAYLELVAAGGQT